MIHTVTLNPALDKTAQVPRFTLDEVNRIQELRVDAGGKGINVSKVIKNLGGTSIAWALLGGATGNKIVDDLLQQDIDVRPFKVSGETRTNLKVVDPELGTHTDINEPGPTVTNDELRSMLQRIMHELSGDDIVVLSGSLPQGADDATYAEWVSECKATGATVFLDADGSKFAQGLKAKPDFVKPNEIELGALVGNQLDTDEKVIDAAKQLVQKGVSHVMVSMGGAGALYVDSSQVVKGYPVKVKVGSTVGAGDSVVAALAYATSTGMPLDDTMRFAMATGAANVMQSGTQAAPLELVQSLIPKVRVEHLE